VAAEVVQRFVHGTFDPSVPQKVSHPIGALGQNLISVLRCERHRREHLAQQFSCDAGMERVRHAVQERHPRLRGHLKIGSRRESVCIVRPNPGPLVRGSPSCWYFDEPIAFRRLAMVIAWQLSHPGEIRSHPVVGFHVTSVHSIFDALMLPLRLDMRATPVAHANTAPELLI
jgi:hypothetical protein